MSDLFLRLPDPQAAVPPQAHLPLGRVMVNAGLITQSDLVHALDLQRHIDAPLGQILVAEGLSSPADILQMLSHQHNIPVADLATDPPDTSLSAALPSAICLKYRCVPWLRIGDVLLVATQHPDDFNRLRTSLGDRGRHILPVLVEEQQIINISAFSTAQNLRRKRRPVCQQPKVAAAGILRLPTANPWH